MTPRFEKAFSEIIQTEGGFVNDPDDHGGATKYGVTIDTLSDFIGHKATVADVQDMDLQTAKEIYFAFYWQPLLLDKITDEKISFFLFDQTVNRGKRHVIEDVQKIVGAKVDGIMGPVTIAAINTHEPKSLLMQIVKVAQLAYASIANSNPKQVKFLTGWIKRTQKFLEA